MKKKRIDLTQKEIDKICNKHFVKFKCTNCPLDLKDGDCLGTLSLINFSDDWLNEEIEVEE